MSCPVFHRAHFVKSSINIICIIHFFSVSAVQILVHPYLSGIGVASLVDVHLRVMDILISKVPLWNQLLCILLSPCLGSTHISSPGFLLCKMFFETTECVVGLFGVKD